MQDWHFRHHARFAAGGLAAAFVEATGVTRDGRITHGCTGIYDDSQLPGLKRVVETYRAHGTVPGIQLAHAGRRASALRPWDGAKPIEAKSGPEAAWQTVAPEPAAGARGLSRAPRAHLAGDRRTGRCLRPGRAPGAVRRLRDRRDPRRPWLSHPFLLLAPFQQAQRRLRRQPGEAHALSAAGGRSGARGLAVGEAGLLSGLGDRQYRGRVARGGQRRPRQGIEGARHRCDRLLRRRHVGLGLAGHQQDPSGLSGGSRGGGAPRCRYPHHGGGRHHRAAAGGGASWWMATPISSPSAAR